MLNERRSLDTLCSALCYAMGIEAPEQSAQPNIELCQYIDTKACGKKADRVFMYNPDAIAQWVYEKYPELFSSARPYMEIELPIRSVMPSVTPVCFGTMYTGAQPCVHGIKKYEKPVIGIDTIFDTMIRAGKKPVIVSYGDSSLSKIFLERHMDYYICDTVDQVNAKTAELILEDRHDFYVIYNGNYDSTMHKNGPESVSALSEIKANCGAFAMFSELINNNWKDHTALVGFAMDHGCHEIDGGCGSHGLDMDEDLEILHLYKLYCGE